MKILEQKNMSARYKNVLHQIECEFRRNCITTSDKTQATVLLYGQERLQNNGHYTLNTSSHCIEHG